MIKTIHTCDRCGKTDDGDAAKTFQWYGVSVCIDDSIYRREHWCEHCVTGLTRWKPPLPDGVKREPLPPTFEDLVKEICNRVIDERA